MRVLLLLFGKVLVDLSEDDGAFVLCRYHNDAALFCQTYESVATARPISFSLHRFLSLIFPSFLLSFFPRIFSLPGKPTHLHAYTPIGRAQPGYWSCLMIHFISQGSLGVCPTLAIYKKRWSRWAIRFKKRLTFITQKLIHFLFVDMRTNLFIIYKTQGRQDGIL